MSGIKCLPDELIEIVDDYTSNFELKEVDNIYEIIKDNTNEKCNIIYSPTIILKYSMGIVGVYYNKKHVLNAWVNDIDRYVILDNKRVIVGDYIYNLEKSGNENWPESRYFNKNEGILNECKEYQWTRGNISIHSLKSRNGNTWLANEGILTRNGIVLSLIPDLCRLTCTIDDKIAVMWSDKNGEIYIYNGEINHIQKKFYRAYGSEYIVDQKGFVFKIQRSSHLF